MAVDEQRANGFEGVAPIVAQADDEVEATLTEPDLRCLLSDETDPDRADHVAWRQTDACGRLSIDRDLQLRKPRQLFRTQIRDAVDAPNQLLRLLGEPRQLIEIRAEDSHRQVRRRAAEALVDPHAQRRREQAPRFRACPRAAPACPLRSPPGRGSGLA